MEKLRFLSLGDSALTVEFSKSISEETNKKVKKLVKAIEKLNIEGVIEIVPAYSSLAIYFNPIKLSISKLKKHIKRALSKKEESVSDKKRVFLIPVCYDGDCAPDMEDVCSLTGLSKNEVIKIHTSKDYLIYMLGFLPGFTYLGGLDERLYCNRLETPRTEIFEGAVGIGGKQTGIYPVKSPGGWRLIGRTPVKVYDSNRKEPVLYRAGDYVRFFAISLDEYKSGKYKELKWEDVL